MFPCKQNGEKGIIVVTMIIKPQTRKIHKMDWWLWKCSITSKVQTVSNILYIRAETRTEANLNPASNEMPVTAGKTAWSALPQRAPRPPRRCRRIPPSPRWGWRLSAAPSAKHVHHRTNFWIDFINIYKSVTGTWNVFGWNNPTLWDNIFTECPGPGWVQQAMIMVLLVSLLCIVS